jgi:hypothetical protein
VLFKWNIDRGPKTYTICIWQQPLHHSDNTRMAVRDRLQVLTTTVYALIPTLHKFRYTLHKEGHGLLDEPLFHCRTNCLIGIEPSALQSLLQWSKYVIVTQGEIGAVRGVSHRGRDRGCKGGDPEHPSQNGAGCPMLCGQHVGVRYSGA